MARVATSTAGPDGAAGAAAATGSGTGAGAGSATAAVGAVGAGSRRAVGVMGSSGGVAPPSLARTVMAWSCSFPASLPASPEPWVTANWPIIRAIVTWLLPFSTSCGRRLAPSNSRPIGA
jgi:hypothetical protein